MTSGVGRVRLAEVCERINEHLYRLDHTDEHHGDNGMHLYNASCYRGGNRCMVSYVSFQHTYALTKREAKVYLRWLDQGNATRHTKILGIT